MKNASGVKFFVTVLLLKRNITDSYTKDEVYIKIIDLVGTAPGLLNTLQEIALALNNDPTFSTTILNSLSTKANITDTFIKTIVL